MKPLQPFLAALLLAAVPAHGAMFGSGSLNIAIPDANPNGISSTISVSGLLPQISDVNVTINVSGGYNGDLYAYLSYDGVLVPLLNRVGTGTGSGIQYYFGYSTSGFNNITLDDQAANGNIHNVANPSSGLSYQPDSGSSSLANFNSYNPNGTWTIFFADMASGGGTATLNSWSLDITAVPEPVNVALGIFAGIVVLAGLARSRVVRERVRHWYGAINHWIDAV